MAGTAYGQSILPEEPKPESKYASVKQIPYALNLGIAEQYNLTKHEYQTVPSIGFDYRFYHQWRVGATFSHNFQQDTYTTAVSINYKILQWGKPR